MANLEILTRMCCHFQLRSFIKALQNTNNANFIFTVALFIGLAVITTDSTCFPNSDDLTSLLIFSLGCFLFSHLLSTNLKRYLENVKYSLTNQLFAHLDLHLEMIPSTHPVRLLVTEAIGVSAEFSPSQSYFTVGRRKMIYMAILIILGVSICGCGLLMLVVMKMVEMKLWRASCPRKYVFCLVFTLAPFFSIDAASAYLRLFDCLVSCNDLR